MGAAPPQLHVVRTTLNYYLDPSQGGEAVYYPGTAGDKRRKHNPREVDVMDIRGNEEDFSLDKQGFQVVDWPSAEKAFDDDHKIKQVYYPDCENLLRKITGATRVHAASHIVRKRTWDETLDAEKYLKDTDKVGGGSTARYIHIDQSYYGAETRVRDYLPFEKIQRLTRTRWAIINVWRPFGYPAEREPLAFCDARSVPESDLRAVKGILPQGDRKGSYLANTGGASLELWHLLPPKEEGAHRWYYCDKVTPNEALLIKQFDSKLDGRARRVPHTAFASDEDRGPPRQSLEVRCFVFWEDEERD